MLKTYQANDLNRSPLTRALSSPGLRTFAINACGAANGLTVSAYLIMALAVWVGPFVPNVRPNLDAAASSMALALGIGVASAMVLFIPRPWRWIALLAAAVVQFFAAMASIPFLF